MENIVRSHPVEQGRWGGGVRKVMQADLCFLSHQQNWHDRQAASMIQTRVRGMLARTFVRNLRARLAREATERAAANKVLVIGTHVHIPICSHVLFWHLMRFNFFFHFFVDHFH